MGSTAWGTSSPGGMAPGTPPPPCRLTGLGSRSATHHTSPQTQLKPGSPLLSSCAHSDKEAPSDTPRAPLPSSIVSIPLLSGTRGKTLTVSSSATAPGPPLRTTWSLHAPATVAPPSDPPPPFKLATSFSPIPSKLVHKVQALEFVEMRELLPDNIALGERLEALPNCPQTPKPTETREVSSLPTWVSAFATYVAIVADSHPTRVRDMMAYMRLIVREAMKHGRTGWATYDQVFRRNNTGPDARWDSLDPSLHIAYIQAQAEWSTVPCAICNEVDHTAEQCALAPMLPATKTASFPRPVASLREWFRPSPARPKGQAPFRPQGGGGLGRNEFAFPGTRGGAYTRGHAVTCTYAPHAGTVIQPGSVRTRPPTLATANPDRPGP